LPDESIFVQIIRILYCVNLFCGYSLTIYPTNNILESYILKKVPRSKARTWLKNFMRFIIVLLGVVSATLLAAKLDKFINILGALLCAPIAFIMPTLVHMTLVAKTKMDMTKDIIILAISITIFVFCTYRSLVNF
jgi:amino acid permease